MRRPNAGRLRSFLSISVGEIRYAIPVECVREVTRPLAIMPVPERPPTALGLVRHKERVLYVYSLRLRFGLPAASEARGFFVFLDLGDTAVALHVDAVQGVFRAGRDSDLATPTTYENDAILFAIKRDEGLVFALDVEPFARAAEAPPLAAHTAGSARESPSETPQTKAS